MNFTHRVLPLLLLIPFISSCLEVPEVDPSDPTDPTAELSVPEGFDFDMTYQQEVSVLAIDEFGEIMPRIQFYIYTAPPEEGGVLLHRGLTNAEGIYRADVQVTTHQKALYAYTPYLDLVRSQRVVLTGEPISFQWGLAPEPIAGAVYKTAIDTTFGCDPSFYQVINNYLKMKNQRSETTANDADIHRMQTQIDQLTERVRVLEKLATDDERGLRDEFKRLA